MYLNKLLILKKLHQANTHLGFGKNGAASYKWSPNTSRSPSYIMGFRGLQPIIAIEETVICLRRAFYVIQLIAQSKGHLLFVNTNSKYNKIIKHTANQVKQSFINYKWVGGFLTNWNHMQNVQQQFHVLNQFSTMGTKFDPLKNASKRLHLGESRHRYVRGTQLAKKARKVSSNFFESSILLDTPRYKKMQKCFNGLIQMQNGFCSKPDCVILLNANENSAAIREAFLSQIPIVSLVDTNIPNELYNLITYPIPANSDSAQFVYLFCNSLVKMISLSKEGSSRGK